MALKEISLAEVLAQTSGTSYFGAFVQLVGKTDNLILYKGIEPQDEALIVQLEEKLKIELSVEYLNFLKIVNGGKIAGMNLFSLDNEENVDSLYYRNFKTDVRKK